MTTEISNTDDVIDSRDVIARIEELESDLAAWIEDYMEEHDLEELDDDDVPPDEEEFWSVKGELDPLKTLAEEGENYAPDWNYGEGLINEEYFTEYCEQLVKDIGDTSELPDYIADNINWDGVAHDLRVDYTEIDFDGATYLIR